jgi:hypothetical protein
MANKQKLLSSVQYRTEKALAVVKKAATQAVLKKVAATQAKLQQREADLTARDALTVNHSARKQADWDADGLSSTQKDRLRAYVTDTHDYFRRIRKYSPEVVESLVQALSDKAGCASLTDKDRRGEDRTASARRSARFRALTMFQGVDGGVPAAMAAIQDFLAASSLEQLERTVPLRFVEFLKAEGAREVACMLKARWTPLLLTDLKIRRKMSAPLYDDIVNTLFRDHDGDKWSSPIVNSVKLPKPMSSYKLRNWGKQVEWPCVGFTCTILVV